MQGADMATSLTYQDAKSLKGQGILHVGRYLDPGLAKSVTKSEVMLLHSNGMGLWLVSETNPTHASYFSRERGLLDAQASLSYANALGVPTNVTLYRAIDYDVVREDMGRIDAYTDALSEVLGDRAGVYGGAPVVARIQQRGRVKHYWQTYAWSGGVILSGIDLYQYRNNVRVAGLSVDLDYVYNTSGLWLPGQGGSKVPNLLQFGSTGPEVKTLQEDLNKIIHAGLAVDGIYGPITAAAVKAFQLHAHIQIDGIAGPQTWGAIDKALSSSPKPNAQTLSADAIAKQLDAAAADIEQAKAALKGV